MSSGRLSPTLSHSHLRLLEKPAPERFNVDGVGVAALRFDEAMEELLAAPRSGRHIRVHFGAMHTFAEASRDESLRDSLGEADLVMPDGMPLVWLGRLRGKDVERICGPDTMLDILDRSREYGYRHFFYGGTAETLGTLAAAMTSRFPGLRIAGLYAPPFRPLTDREVQEVTDRINGAAPDFVWVSLGSPKQDQWLANFRPLLNASVLLGVGAAFDFHAGVRPRAPLWAQRNGLEWAFRFLYEPRRLAKRYLKMAAYLGRSAVNELLKPREVHASDAQW